MDQAALNGHADLVRVLTEHGAALRPAAAVALGRVDVIDALLREDPDCLRPGKRWGTLILRAAERGSGAVIDALIAHGASPNVEDSPDTSVDGTYGYTPLHAAAFHGNVSAARALIAHGANVTARETRYFGTPIGWATYARHQEVVDLLLESGPADIFDAVEHGRSDLVRAAVERDPGALERPLGDYLGVEPPDWLKPRWRPITFAKEHGKQDVVRVLLDLGATVDVKSEDSPLGAEP